MPPTATAQRNLSISLAGTDPEQALKVARGIKEPWFRCQALSHVARYWPGNDFRIFLEEAIKAAENQDNCYKRVSVSAWPIRAYLERDSCGPAKILLKKYTAETINIENMGGRSEALLILFEAARPYDISLWEPIFWALIAAAEPFLAWRQLRNVRQAASMIALDNPNLIVEATKRLSNEQFIAAITRDLQNRRVAEPRPFFWSN